MAAIGTEKGGRTLALGRNLVSYVIAADLIDLKRYDAGSDQQFRSWLAAVRKETLDGKTLISTHEVRPNNWGTHAGASRVAADRYLGDKADLARAAQVFKGWLGDRSAYAGFKYGELAWQAARRAGGHQSQGCDKNGQSSTACCRMTSAAPVASPGRHSRRTTSGKDCRVRSCRPSCCHRPAMTPGTGRTKPCSGR